MNNNTLLVIVILISNSNAFAMDQQESSTSKAVTPIKNQTLSPHLEIEHKVTGHKDRRSLTLSISVPESSQGKQSTDADATTSKKHDVSPSEGFTSESLPETEKATQKKHKGHQHKDRDSVIIEIEMPDLENPSDEALDKIVDKLIVQASIAAFGEHHKDAFYVAELKAALKQSFIEFIKMRSKSKSPSASSSVSDSSEEPQPISKKHEDSLVYPKQEAVERLRAIVFERISPKHLKVSELKEKETAVPEAAPSATKSADSEGMSHKDLKEWFMRELELHDLKMREQEREMRDKAAKYQGKLDEAHRKTKYAVIATAVTTISGIAVTLATYFTTHSLHPGSN